MCWKGKPNSNFFKEEGIKMKKMIFGTILIFLIVGFFGLNAASARPQEFNFNLFINAKHARFVHCHKPWMEMLAKKSNGQIKITPYFMNSLAPLPEKFNSTVDGIADISEGVVFVNPGRFPMSEMLMLPELGLKTAEKAGKAWWHLYNTMPAMQKEYKGVKMLFLHASPKMMLATKNKEIKTVADMKGLKVWTPGRIPAKTAKALGMTPVALSPGEIYLALDKGVIDGTWADFEINLARRFYEVTKYQVTNLYMNHAPFYLIMNQGLWDGLPMDVKKVFEGLTGDWAVEWYGKVRDEEEHHAHDILKEKMKLIQLPPSELAKVKKMVEPVKATYAAELEAKGLPGKKALAELLNFK
jgi:TRAP-type C4-dicarboxylate transport system substrate-binding protein